MNRPPLPIETVVEPWGKISAISWQEGERYYMLVDKAGTVSLMPADLIERAAEPQPGSPDA